jgi:hypothetical protein
MEKLFPLFFNLIILLLSILNSVQGQDQQENNIILVYSNFNKGLSQDDLSTAFEIKRVYLGYIKAIDQNFTAEVKLDIGSPEDLSEYSLIRRYAYFKTASLTYQKDKLTIWSGLFNMQQFAMQERTWGYRYIFKSFQDEHKFGPSADIGVGIKYHLNDYFSADLVISNGEGYKNLQSDNSYKTGAGISVYPFAGWKFRFYYDFLPSEYTQSTYAFFLAYQNQKYRLGAEYNLENNFDQISEHNLIGISLYGTRVFNEKWEIFARYDILESNILNEEDLPWNIYHDGSSIITGFQYCPVAGINISLNYQDWYSYAANGPNNSYLFINLEFRI